MASYAIQKSGVLYIRAGLSVAAKETRMLWSEGKSESIVCFGYGFMLRTSNGATQIVVKASRCGPLYRWRNR